MSSNEDWKKWGKSNPYFGVVTHEEFRRENLTEESLARFFRSGEKHVEHIFDVFEKHFAKALRPRLAVDYGCGTGRVVLPLARRCDKVVGLDVSEGMLAEAKQNTDKSGIHNIEYRLITDDEISILSDTVDFLHSYIVFQHIPRARGEVILHRLLSKLAISGFAALHFTIDSKLALLQRSTSWARNHVPLVHPIFNLLQGKPLAEPRMRMEKYSLPSLLEIIEMFAADGVFCERTNHGGHVGVILYFQRTR